MNIAERLESVRQEFPECKTIAYADISTNMILSTSAETELHQEHLNSLCKTAVDMLGGPLSPPLRSLLGSDHGEGIFKVIIIEPSEVGIFLKSTTSPTDALCCVCSASINLGPFITGARHQLDEIGQDE